MYSKSGQIVSESEIIDIVNYYESITKDSGVWFSLIRNPWQSIFVITSITAVIIYSFFNDLIYDYPIAIACLAGCVGGLIADRYHFNKATDKTIEAARSLGVNLDRREVIAIINKYL